MFSGMVLRSPSKALSFRGDLLAWDVILPPLTTTPLHQYMEKSWTTFYLGLNKVRPTFGLCSHPFLLGMDPASLLAAVEGGGL